MSLKLDGTPKCKCGAKLSRMSPKLQRTWESSLNEKWYHLSEQQAFFRFCVTCHKREWPEDTNRCQGPHCHPSGRPWAKWAQTADGVSKLLSGDFWLTRAPPELKRERSASSLEETGPDPLRRRTGRVRKGLQLSWADGGQGERRGPHSTGKTGAAGWGKTPEERRQAWDEAPQQDAATATQTDTQTHRPRPGPLGAFCQCKYDTGGGPRLNLSNPRLPTLSVIRLIANIAIFAMF